MNPAITTLLVALGGGVGASLRYWTGVSAQALGFSWPVGTFIANVVGCFIIGAVADSVMRSPIAHPALITGVLGGFTTFSSFAFETVRLAEAGRLVAAGAYSIGTFTLCIAAALAGAIVARMVT